MTKLKNYVVSMVIDITATSPEAAAEMAQENFGELLESSSIIFGVKEEGNPSAETFITTDEHGEYVEMEITRCGGRI